MPISYIKHTICFHNQVKICERNRSYQTTFYALYGNFGVVASCPKLNIPLRAGFKSTESRESEVFLRKIVKI